MFEPYGMLEYTFVMSFNLPLKEMTLREKLSAMELLWENLARNVEAVGSPAWHKQILDKGGQQAAEGQARFVDWGVAKANIRKLL